MDVTDDSAMGRDEREGLAGFAQQENTPPPPSTRSLSLDQRTPQQAFGDGDSKLDRDLINEEDIIILNSEDDLDMAPSLTGRGSGGTTDEEEEDDDPMLGVESAQHMPESSSVLRNTTSPRRNLMMSASDISPPTPLPIRNRLYEEENVGGYAQRDEDSSYGVDESSSFPTPYQTTLLLPLDQSDPIIKVAPREDSILEVSQYTTVQVPLLEAFLKSLSELLTDQYIELWLKRNYSRLLDQVKLPLMLHKLSRHQKYRFIPEVNWGLVQSFSKLSPSDDLLIFQVDFHEADDASDDKAKMIATGLNRTSVGWNIGPVRRDSRVADNFIFRRFQLESEMTNSNKTTSNVLKVYE